MDVFIHPRWKLRPKELKRLNACRMYLQVVLTVADIADGTGLYLMPTVLQDLYFIDRKIQ